MPRSEEIVEELLTHAYDPVKAHEYYLRTRKLKGRKPAAKQYYKVGASQTTKKTVAKKAAPKKSSAQKRKELEAKAKELQARLDALRKILTELVRQAQSRSGLKPRASQSTKDSGGKKKMTTKQKADAAKRSKEYYEKNKTPQQKIKEIQAKIKTVMEKIQRAMAKLEKAKKSSKKRGSVGAGNYSVYK